MAVKEALKLLEGFIRDHLGQAGYIALHEPWFHGNEWQRVKNCLDSGWVSSVGEYVEEFEAKLLSLVAPSLPSQLSTARQRYMFP